MERRRLGRTGLEVSVLGFGCGAVGGLMVKGAAADQERAVARAIELGINYFDTAPSYGDGVSERNLGRVLRSLDADVVVGTKVRLDTVEPAAIGPAITASLEDSLRRLGREQVDLLQLHNPITVAGGGHPVAAAVVLDGAVPAFERLRDQGKIRFFGITAIGDAAALVPVIAARRLDTAQVPYNLLNPSAGTSLPAGYPAQDYDRLLAHARAADMGVIGIRVLAGGALSGDEARHPLGVPSPEPIGSGADYRTDVGRARRFEPLVREGHAASLVEAALRFAIADPAVGTVMIGTATLGQLETAAAAVNRGPLSPAALARVAELQRGFVGEPR